VTGVAGAVVTANNEFLTTTDCTRNADWNAYVCPPGTEHVSLISETLEGRPENIKPLTITRESDGQTPMGCCDDSTDAVTNLLTDQNYEAAFNRGTPARFKFILYEGGEDKVSWLRMSVPYAQTPKVTKYGCDVASTRWCDGGKTTSFTDGAGRGDPGPRRLDPMEAQGRALDQRRYRPLFLRPRAMRTGHHAVPVGRAGLPRRPGAGAGRR
jgi:hypothetical protein